MSDDLTVMGIAATAAAAMGREQIVLAHQAEHPLAGNPDVATDPKPSPDLAVALALPGRCLQVGFDRHQQRLVRDRGLRSPTLCRRLLGVLAGGHGVERGAGHAPGGADPPQAVGQTRAGRGGGTHRRDLRRPAEGLRLGLQQFHLHGQLSDPLHGAIQFRLHRIALALLERGVDPADRFLTPLLEPEDLYAQLARQKLHRLVTQKPQNDLTLARHRPSLANSQRACRQSLAWGKRGREARPHLPQAHQQQLSSQNYRSCSGPPWTLRLSQFCVQGNRVGMRASKRAICRLRFLFSNSTGSGSAGKRKSSGSSRTPIPRDRSLTSSPRSAVATNTLTPDWRV